MKKYVNGKLVELTTEEITAFETGQAKAQTEINAEKQEKQDAETKKASGKAKLKAGEALTDDEISALFGDN
tara:strand:- start:28 stop:240 length:213 start_codon:yes stop_codon:yes gene_type:complete